jgi:hypothetical protein
MFSLVTKYLLIIAVFVHSFMSVSGHCCAAPVAEKQQQHVHCNPLCVGAKDKDHSHEHQDDQRGEPHGSPLTESEHHRYCDRDHATCQFVAVTSVRSVDTDLNVDRLLDQTQVYFLQPILASSDGFGRLFFEDGNSSFSTLKVRLHLFLGHFLI